MNGNNETKVDEAYLSKSLFVRGVRCHKSLYLQKYRPELKDEVSEETENKFEIGFEIGDLAQELFPGGVIVPYEGLSHKEQIEMTASLIAKGCNTIYEATFFYNGVFIKADILHQGDNGWDVYEVKASTSVRDYHHFDAAVQYYVITGAGLTLSRVFLVHVNSKYVRQGEIEVDQLFHKADITTIAKEKQTFVVEEIERQREMLMGEEPIVDIGSYCNKPYECDFIGHCWSHIPSQSVFEFRGIGKPDGFALNRQGIDKMEDVSPDILGWRQKLQLDGLLHQKNHIDVDAVRNFLQSLWYPLCFMDFETTYMVPIPIYDGTRPYQQVTFQFSADVINKQGGELEHHEFLADGTTNPQKEFVERLLTIVPSNACVLVWNQSFENTRLKELADAFPEKSSEIDHLINNVRDLMKPFQDKSIYHWQFNGAYSIKVVLPALVPELSYENLDISDGAAASSTWLRMIQSKDDEEKSALRKQLLQYCHLDTLAMVKILQIMKDMAK
jgi:hypothetical protein